MKRYIDGRIAHDLTAHTERSEDVKIDSEITFNDLQLNPNVLKGLNDAGFVNPSPIQLKSIPLGRCGVDLVVQSKSGTGKTCVFTVIILESLLSSMSPEKCQSTQALVVTPTREIATQVTQVISTLARPLAHVKCGYFIGGTQFKLDRKKLDEVSGCQIVIGTPGRLRQLIELNVLRTDTINIFVLDEADKLMDEQFKEQINAIYRLLPADKQMIATSATYPQQLAEFISQYMQAPQFVRLCTTKNLALKGVKQFYIWCDCGHSAKATEDLKFKLLIKLLSYFNDSYQQCIVFTNYQVRAPKVCKYLNENLGPKLSVENSVVYLSSELSQNEREKIFQRFKASKNRVLISTDIAARGIDIRDIDLVINLDTPNDMLTYYHRIGRAGRFGTPGRAITILAKNWPADTNFLQKLLHTFDDSISESQIEDLNISK